MLDTVGPEVILALPAKNNPVKHMRSTILLGSIASLRAAGHIDAYRSALEPRHHETLFQAVAGIWIPLDVAMAHYRACESLGLAPDKVVELGRSTFDKTGGTLFGTVLRLAKGAGVNPWTVLPQLQRFWDRGYDGGGIRVLRLGPKEARIELVQCAIADSSYFRYALRGVVVAVLHMFCSRAYVHEQALSALAGQASALAGRTPKPGGTMALRAQWA
jgi:hypothetical protein